MTELESLLQRLIREGADANELQREFDTAVSETLDWALFGGGHWRRRMVCSKCGSELAGLCANLGANVKFDHLANPAFHKHQPGVRLIPYKEYLVEHGEMPD